MSTSVEVCPVCAGTGHGSPEMRAGGLLFCVCCHGSGVVEFTYFGFNNQNKESTVNAHVPKRAASHICGVCNGSGSGGHMLDCSVCKGKGQILVEDAGPQEVRVNVPPGVDADALAKQIEECCNSLRRAELLRIEDIGAGAYSRMAAGINSEAEMRNARKVGCGGKLPQFPQRGRIACGDFWEGNPCFCSDACLTKYEAAVSDETPTLKQVRTSTKPPTAAEILRKAADTMEERGKQYDSPTGERSMGKAVAAFNAITCRGLSTEEGWLLMGLVKSVRQYTSGKRHEDSAIDHVAYAALEAEEVLEVLLKGGAT